MALKIKYNILEDWVGDLYCGISLKLYYIAHTLDLSIPGYIKINFKSTNMTALSVHSTPPI